jgi:hypothetical protein
MSSDLHRIGVLGWLYISPSEVLHTAAWVCLDEAGWGPRHFRGGAASCIRFDEAQAKSVSVSTRFLSITFWFFLFVVHIDGIDGYASVQNTIRLH